MVVVPETEIRGGEQRAKEGSCSHVANDPFTVLLHCDELYRDVFSRRRACDGIAQRNPRCLRCRRRRRGRFQWCRRGGLRGFEAGRKRVSARAEAVPWYRHVLHVAALAGRGRAAEVEAGRRLLRQRPRHDAVHRQGGDGPGLARGAGSLLDRLLRHGCAARRRRTHCRSRHGQPQRTAGDQGEGRRRCDSPGGGRPAAAAEFRPFVPGPQTFTRVVVGGDMRSGDNILSSDRKGFTYDSVAKGTSHRLPVYEYTLRINMEESGIVSSFKRKTKPAT